MTMDSEEADRRTDREGHTQTEGQTDDRQTDERATFSGASFVRAARCGAAVNFMFCLLLLRLLLFARLLPVLIPPTDHWAETI